MAQIVERLDLIQAALDVLRERHLLIEAAAGYGKSVLLGQLVRYLPGAVRLRLTVDDNDVAVFRQRIQAAGAQTLLLDDAHLLATGSEAAGWLQQHVATGDPRLVVAGRYLPFKALPALAQDLAVRWDEDALAFSAETVAQILHEERAEAWHEQMAGWPLGIGLLQQLAPAQREQAVVRGLLFDYLAQAVFDGLPRDLQTFLRLTAVPVEFSAPLVAHLEDSPVETVAAQIQFVEQRNLFIDRGSRPDTCRYHDLFRDFLLTQSTPAERQGVAGQTVRYLVAHDQYPLAVEQALDAGLYQLAAALLLEVKWEFLHATYRYRTFDRWVRALPQAVRDAHPALYWMAGHCLIYLPDREGDAFAYFERSEALALAAGDGATVSTARYEHAHLRYMLEGASPGLADTLARIAREAPADQNSGVRSLRTLSSLQAELGHFREAQATWHRAYQRAEQMGFGEMLLEMMKRQYALYMLTPLGAYAEARALFAGAIEQTADSPGNQLEVLANYCDLLLAMGAWDELAAIREQIDVLARQMDDLADYVRLWLHYYDGMTAVARGQLERAEAELNAMGVGDDHGLELVCERLGRIWLARRHGDLQPLPGWLAEVAAHHQNAPYYVTLAFLEADIARGLAAVAAGQPFAVSPETLALYRFRARGDLLRLRTLLTVLCYHQQQRRWRHLARITLRELERPHYWQLLTQRDPELGASFWSVLLAEGLCAQQAARALAEARIVKPLLPLLAHETAGVRRQSALTLAQIGDERAMGALNEALGTEKESATKEALEKALARLEALPPPALHVDLMGGFAVRRGDVVIDDFHRPIVARLLQFFAIHRGQPLARDLILEALWPGSDPDKAWRTFRTVYSRLRNALEPHMRSKGPNRYFSLDGDSYTFDPGGYVAVDVEHFQRQLRADLPAAQLVPLLDAYQPVLPELPYADWLLELRERLEALYLDACLRVGQQLLAHGDAAQAQQWAQRVIRTAPWLEAAYQLLMRTYARQNLRSRALRTYAEAREALATELAVAPSPLTEWLYTRLQAGETI